MNVKFLFLIPCSLFLYFFAAGHRAHAEEGLSGETEPQSPIVIVVRHSEKRIPSRKDEEHSFAEARRFYVAGFYTASSWNDTGGAGGAPGKISSSWDIAAGGRVTDNFRLELNYHALAANYDIAEYNYGTTHSLELGGYAFFLNAIYDGRIDSKFARMHRQILVPYVGLGAGFAQINTRGEDVEIGRKSSPAFAVLAGIALEFGKTFSLDFGYRYMQIIAPKIILEEEDTGISPAAHQLRVGAKINF